MALKKCKECGNEVSTKAASCPKCGAILRKKIGCLGYIGVAFLIFILLGVFGMLMNDETSETSSSGSSSVTSKSQSQSKTIISTKKGKPLVLDIRPTQFGVRGGQVA